MPEDFKKGQYFKKIKWGVICLHRMNSLKINFFGYLKTKTALCLYGEYAKQQNIYLKSAHLIIIRI